MPAIRRCGSALVLLLGLSGSLVAAHEVAPQWSRQNGLDVWNLAPPDETSVSRIAALCVAASPYKDAEIRFTGGDRGWPGDVPRSRMSPEKLGLLGYAVRFTSDEAVELAVTALAREVFPESPAA